MNSTVKEFFLSKTFAGILLMFAGYFFGGDVAAVTLGSNPDMLSMVTTALVSAGGGLATFGSWRRVKKTKDLTLEVDKVEDLEHRLKEAQTLLDRRIKEVDSLKNNPPSVEVAAKVMSAYARANRKPKTKNPLA